MGFAYRIGCIRFSKKNQYMDFNNKVAIVTSENTYISGGMTRQMICHGDNGWRLSPME